MSNEELVLLVKLGNQDAYEKLIEQNHKYVYRLMHKYYNYPAEEIVSSAWEGFVKACHKYDCNKGARFLTFASRCMENEILMYIRSQRKVAEYISLQSAIPGAEEEKTSLEDILPGEGHSKIEEAIFMRSFRQVLGEFLSGLSDQEQDLLVGRLFRGEDQQILAQKHCISQSQVSRKVKQLRIRFREYARRCELVG